MGAGPRGSVLLTLLFLFSLPSLLGVAFVAAQDPTSSTSSISESLTTVLTTSSYTTTSVTRSGEQDVTITTVLPTTVNATVTLTPTATESATPITLDTRIDPGFGVLGAILIITGLPSTFWGHKNRWSSFFLIGFYTFALACLALILKFGVLDSVNPPSTALRGVFVLACCIAGIAGGGVSIFFWQQAKYFIGAWGGFALGLWVQCFRNGGLIRPIGFRWILYIALSVIGFCLCTIPKIHYQILLASTASVGATAFILGIDCFTTAGLKEFYVWNLGFNSLFPKYQENGIQFPVTQMMQIELGLIGAFTLMGAAVQLRILKILQMKLKEIHLEHKRRDEELEAQATARFAVTAKEMEEWENEHGRKTSHVSSTPLMKDHEGASPGTEEASQFTLVHGGGPRPRYQSNVSDFMAASPPLDDEFGRPRDRRQSIGALPALDLGLGIQRDLPADFVDEGALKGTSTPKKPLTAQELEDLKRKEDLVAEIQSIRKSIEALRAETPASSSHSDTRSRHPSYTSRRTLSQDLATVMQTPARPPRTQDPRARVASFELLRVGSEGAGSLAPDAASISRPSSAPLRDEDWNSYVRERKLFQPPAGVTAPIATTPHSPQPRPVQVPQAVSEALMRRHQQESVLAGEFGQLDGHGRSSTHGSSSGGDRPAAVHKGAAGAGSKAPVTILPPRKADPAPAKAATQPRTRTFEELNERHREMMRNLQSPLSRAERERAEVEAARIRWEKSKTVEKQVMAKREAEKQHSTKEKDKEKEKEKKPSGGKQDASPKGPKEPRPEPRRSLSVDRLGVAAGGGSTSKRQSVMKVEDWRRHQQEGPGGQAQAGSVAKRDSAVPFPVGKREPGRSPPERRTSQMPGSMGNRF